MEEIIFYILMFIIGTVFGSFFTLAVYRIPLHQDITHKRSYCPKCKHRLSFFDMIPVLSYIFLGGKCRYCKEKIRIRYFLLEILTGIVFLLFGMSLNISFNPINVNSIIALSIGFLYIAGIIIIAGIDKETRKIEKGLLLYEIFVVCSYIVYLYIVGNTNIHTYAIYLIVLTLLLLVDDLYIRKQIKGSYTLDILELSMIMTIFAGAKVYILSVICTLVSIVVGRLIQMFNTRKIKKVSKKRVAYYDNVKIAFYLGCYNIIFLILSNFIYM